jgi:hypothetical protein
MIKWRRLRLAGNVARLRQTRNACKILVGKSEGNKSLEIPRRRREVKIELGVKEIGSEDVDWIRLAG